MGIGVSIFLIAVGAILTFATNIEISGIDLQVVGVVLMAAGVLGLLMTLLIWGPRRRVVRAERPVVEEERTVYEDRPPL